ncbi:phage major capsid protein [Paenibacillus lycopersici]|uniref:Phage major capsid protein n=1 Tax=Paenibacillus lycopersici TaxID=2704462 RepID=A0A6C0G4I0_9BACL|nr:phage major capsid protein [Paenibacillus lycopersici]QHT61700.1 phage major capsid protein [Paenibacillus lycopersici]
MAFDLAAANAVFKEDYHGPVREQLNNDNPVTKRLVQNKQEATGKRFFVPLHYGRNNSVGYRAEGAALPTAGNQKYKETTANVRYLYGGIEISGPTIKAMRNDKGAFIRAVESEMKGLVRDLKDQRSRALFGDGTGRIGTFAVNTSVNTLTVDKIKYFQIGMKIDIVNNSGTVTQTGRTITNLDKANKTITIDGAAVTTAATDYAVVTGDLNNEAMGIGGIMSASLQLQGIDPASNPWWKPSVLANGGTPRAISQLLMRQAIDTAELEGGKIDWITTSYGVRAAYEALLQQNVRYTKPMTLEGGENVLEYDGLPIFVDRYHESNRMFFVDSGEIDLYQLSDFEWMEDDKGAALAPVPGYDKYAATMFCYETLVTYKRNAHTALMDLTEAPGYAV